MSDSEKLLRARSTDLDSILGAPFKVLDDGFIRAIDYMGDDSSIVRAARVSYGAGTKRVRRDRGLIRYLMRHRHTTPFEMCALTIHVRVPMDTWRQWIRHRTANVNEYSTRYSVAIDAAAQTRSAEWRMQNAENRQGSIGLLSEEVGSRLSRAEAKLHKNSRAVYDARISAGVAREQARKDLPLSTYTEAYWKIDLHNLFHFLALRMDSHAQSEIRQYANTIGNEIVRRWVPLAWEAFKDYRLESVALSRIEIAVISKLSEGDKRGAISIADSEGLLPMSGDEIQDNRERFELEEKLRSLGIPIPWETP